MKGAGKWEIEPRLDPRDGHWFAWLKSPKGSVHASLFVEETAKKIVELLNKEEEA